MKALFRKQFEENAASSIFFRRNLYSELNKLNQLYNSAHGMALTVSIISEMDPWCKLIEGSNLQFE